MIDSIFIAMSGMNGYQNGLRVIANNTANLNTPGFKGSGLQFADLFYGGDASLGGGDGQYGFGVNTLGTTLRLQQGQLQNTSNGLDLAIDGDGMFVLRDAAGHIHYTRDGQFKFNSDDQLVSATTGEQVMALQDDGTLAPVTLASLRTNAAQATTTVTFAQNLSSNDQVSTYTVGNVSVTDASGATHQLSVRLDKVAGTPGAWDVTLLDGTTTVGTGRIAFVGNQPDPNQSRVTITYTPNGQPAMPLTLDFSGTTNYDMGTQSTLVMQQQNGYGMGNLTGVAFDATGTLLLSYSNKQTAKPFRLALGRFSSQDAIGEVGNNEFEAKDPSAWSMGRATDPGFGQVKAGMLELSNVDLSQEFSDLVIMQRGYQASSQVVSTANQMLSDLFAIQGK